MKYAFIRRERVFYPVVVLCRVLEVPEQGYYAWLKRGPSRRAEEDAILRTRVRVLFFHLKRRYGSPRLHQELRDEGISVGRHRVARLMREEGLRAKAARKFRATTDSSHGKAVCPNTLNREFIVEKPNQVWVGDITYLWTREGWLYLAVFIDLCSRGVVGWKLGTRLTANLVTGAFERAMMRRRPPPGLLIHTDQGTQYVSQEFADAIKSSNVELSMSRKGNCWDNAVAESFFHSLKVEAIYGSDIQTRREMELEVFDYIERFYNPIRKHSTIGYRSPEIFEKQMELMAA